MKIAFDLDNTLIRCGYNFNTEEPQKKLWAKLFGIELLRAGTMEIFAYCQSQGWETWIYTTSFRSSIYIKRLFWLYGIKLQGVVNQSIHNQTVKVNSSKHPPSFGLDVVIDDSKGILIEAQRFNFTAIWLKPDDANWVEYLKEQLIEIHKKLHLESYEHNRF